MCARDLEPRDRVHSQWADQLLSYDHDHHDTQEGRGERKDDHGRCVSSILSHHSSLDPGRRTGLYVTSPLPIRETRLEPGHGCLDVAGRPGRAPSRRANGGDP